mmetsp:Transcript_59226/g.114323  ORF Transcript_59226/g.114323 Transcript_59226/m.114323 type:complete len:114 (-) Transcript_59226:169-510(-)
MPARTKPWLLEVVQGKVHLWEPDARPTRQVQVNCVCRRCGHVNQYDLPPVGRSFPSVRCEACNQVAQRLGYVTHNCWKRAEAAADDMAMPMRTVKNGENAHWRCLPAKVLYNV